jgi:hypothetical protein
VQILVTVLRVSVVITVVRYNLYACTLIMVLVVQAFELTQLDDARASRGFPVDDYDAFAVVRINI